MNSSRYWFFVNSFLINGTFFSPRYPGLGFAKSSGENKSTSGLNTTASVPMALIACDFNPGKNFAAPQTGSGFKICLSLRNDETKMLQPDVNTLIRSIAALLGQAMSNRLKMFSLKGDFIMVYFYKYLFLFNPY